MKYVLLLLLGLLTASSASAAEPDYRLWQELLSKHYDPAKGMNYKALKADKAALDRLRNQMAAVDPASLSRPEQLAYWINLYNVNVVGVVVDNYPVESIRDISTDPIVRLNVFKKPYVRTRSGEMSLDDVEHRKIREGFKDPRIHFAINCAAESCPPIRPEPYVGARIGQQLDDQTRKFLNATVRVDGDTVRVTKILDWFKDDFEQWGGGTIPFLGKYLSRKIGPKARIEYDDYSWKLNDWRR